MHGYNRESDYSLPGGSHDHAFLPSRRRKFNYVLMFLLVIVIFMWARPGVSVDKEVAVKSEDKSKPSNLSEDIKDQSKPNNSSTDNKDHSKKINSSTENKEQSEAKKTPSDNKEQPEAKKTPTVIKDQSEAKTPPTDNKNLISSDFLKTFQSAYDNVVFITNDCTQCKDATFLEKAKDIASINLSSMKDANLRIKAIQEFSKQTEGPWIYRDQKLIPFKVFIEPTVASSS